MLSITRTFHPGWPSTRRRTSCPARTWASSSARHWWGPPSWTPWRRSMTSDTRDWWWKHSLPTKTCCSERKGGKRSFWRGEEGQSDWDDAHTVCIILLMDFWHENEGETSKIHETCVLVDIKDTACFCVEQWRKWLFAKKEFKKAEWRLLKHTVALKKEVDGRMQCFPTFLM